MKSPPASFSHRSDPQRGPGRLTDSAARTDVVLLIRRTVRPSGYASGFDSPAALLGRRRVSTRQGWAGEMSGHFDQPDRKDMLVLSGSYLTQLTLSFGGVETEHRLPRSAHAR